MASPTELESILYNVTLTGEIGQEDLVYDEELGFLALKGSETGGGLTVVGFYTPSRAEGTPPKQLELITELDEVLPENRTIDLQGKGVGRRLYNSPAATLGLAYRPRFVGAYPYQVNREAVLDTRSIGEQSLVGKLQRIARHAGRIAGSKQTSLDEVVAGIHQGYGDAEAVIMSQPPVPAIRQMLRGINNPVPPAFLLTRRQGEPLPRIGHRFVAGL